jgi:nucleotide-binding universal stress UspA family protein
MANASTAGQVIVVAIDLSEASRAVFDAAIEIGRSTPSAHLHLVHVTSSARVKQPGRPDDATLAAWASRLPQVPCPIDLHGLEGEDAATAIVEFARDRGADLIVIGTHGRTGLRRLLIGSVAELVVRNASCSVLVVRGKAA